MCPEASGQAEREDGLKITVLVKQVPSSEARIKIAAEGKTIDPAEVAYVINPYDEYAIEAALRLKEKFGGEVIAISAGPAKAEEALRSCLALGADRALLVRDDSLAGGDSAAAARLLAAACRRAEADVILCGKLSIDFENSAVGVQVAEILGIPHVSVVTGLEAGSPDRFEVRREIEGGAEVIEVAPPVVLTANKGLNEPRYASLKGIMAAKKKPLEAVTPADLGIAGDAPAGTTVVGMEYPPARSEGKRATGDAAEAARTLVGWLRDDARIL